MGTQVYPSQSTTALPVGAATAALQTAGNNSLASIDSKIPSGLATSAKQDTGNSSLSSIDTKLTSQATAALQTAGNASLTSIDGKTPALGQALMAASVPVTIASNQTAFPVTPATLTVVDQIDTTPLLDLSSVNIPASSANSLSLVASLAAAVKKVITVEDIGEFLGLYSGPVATPTLLCILPLGGGEVDISIPAGTLVSIRHMKNSAIASGFIAINFLG